MLLAVDTSTSQIGISVYDEAQVVAEIVLRSGRHHTRVLAMLVEQALRQASLSPTDLAVIAVALGPGSFTGLRVGLAFAKGMAGALAVPIVGVPTFEVVAAATPLLGGYERLAAVLPAGRKRLAVGWYFSQDGRWRSRGAPEVLTADQLADRIRRPTVVCGELRPEERARLARKWKNALLPSPAACVRRPAYLAELAWERYRHGEVDDVASLAPIYLHTGTPIPT